MMPGWQDFWHDMKTHPQRELVAPEDRCWKCDSRRLHEGCAAGLCRDCCDALKDVAA